MRLVNDNTPLVNAPLRQYDFVIFFFHKVTDFYAVPMYLYLLSNWQKMPFGHITPVRMVVCRLMV